MSGLDLSRTACTRCRNQKLKCSREYPNCLRCRRLHGHCVYPRPHDRSRQRAERALADAATLAESMQTRKSHLEPLPSQGDFPNSVLSRQHSPQHEQAHPRYSILPGQHVQTRIEAYVSSTNSEVLRTVVDIPSDSYPHQLRDAQNNRDNGQANHAPRAEDCALPPFSAGLGLLEIYFSRVYNASLLFWKPLLFQQYVEGKIPAFLLRAIFAISALFVDSNQRNLEGYSELRALGAFRHLSLSWAQAAAREACSLATLDPSLEVIQTLECLTLYWFGTGQSKSGDLSLALAYRCCCVLGFNQSKSSEIPKASLDAELQRRCLWACWASMCIVAAPEPYLRCWWSEVAQVPLPARIDREGCVIKITQKQYLDANWVPHDIQGQEGVDHVLPTAAVLMKMVGVWAKVQLFALDRQDSGPSSILEEPTALATWAASVHASISLGQRQKILDEAAPGDVFDEAHLLFVCDALHNLSQITVYSTMVPLFCGPKAQASVDSSSAQLSARIVVENAWSFANQLKAYRASRRDATYMCPLIGHCAFTTAAVLLTFEFSRRKKGSDGFIPGLESVDTVLPIVQTNLKILGELCRYWEVLRRPCDKILAALESLTVSAGARISSLSVDSDRSTRQHPRQALAAPFASNRLHISSQPSHGLQEQLHINTDMPLQPPSANGSSQLTINYLSFNPEPQANSGEILYDIDTLGMDDWWNSSFTDVGYENLAVLEPMMLSRGSWDGLQ
ncbi:hypothetical protein PV08_11832 [Exophiala spinifera]|uniref:Zn(2)-C6 fungal-type domain-containing protein n=1 Tax=Exophiala spinifera TaxID=91928 RepID=A0A0D1Y568_9EURO|nr:uncharacterized protein PV08_11832 [Exophiala spinifera]KIW10056.1 hypothetical protein PV08_11832 [Exophiala spinifera]